MDLLCISHKLGSVTTEAAERWLYADILLLTAEINNTQPSLDEIGFPLQKVMHENTLHQKTNIFMYAGNLKYLNHCTLNFCI